MRFLASLLLGLVLLVGSSISAQTVAPVQIEVKDGSRFTWYDCYPAAPSNDQDGMWVYLNQPDGIAIYHCTGMTDYEVKPVKPSRIMVKNVRPPPAPIRAARAEVISSLTLVPYGGKK